MCKTAVITTTLQVLLPSQLRHLKIKLEIGASVSYSFNFILPFTLEYASKFVLCQQCVRMSEWSKVQVSVQFTGREFKSHF